MTSSYKTLLVLAALSGLISVIAAAFGAHGLADPTARDWMRTASGFEMTNALAVFACVFVARMGAVRAPLSAVLFLIGSVLFCGSIYAVALGAPRVVSLGAPIGGLVSIAGWILLCWTLSRMKAAA